MTRKSSPYQITMSSQKSYGGAHLTHGIELHYSIQFQTSSKQCNQRNYSDETTYSTRKIELHNKIISFELQ